MSSVCDEPAYAERRAATIALNPRPHLVLKLRIRLELPEHTILFGAKVLQHELRATPQDQQQEKRKVT